MAKKNAPETGLLCPQCRQNDLVPVVYGYPGSNLQQRASEGRVFLGGCVVMGDDPLWRCNDCGLRWR